MEKHHILFEDDLIKAIDHAQPIGFIWKQSHIGECLAFCIEALHERWPVVVYDKNRGAVYLGEITHLETRDIGDPESPYPLESLTKLHPRSGIDMPMERFLTANVGGIAHIRILSEWDMERESLYRPSHTIEPGSIVTKATAELYRHFTCDGVELGTHPAAPEIPVRIDPEILYRQDILFKGSTWEPQILVLKSLLSPSRQWLSDNHIKVIVISTLLSSPDLDIPHDGITYANNLQNIPVTDARQILRMAEIETTHLKIDFLEKAMKKHPLSDPEGLGELLQSDFMVPERYGWIEASMERLSPYLGHRSYDALLKKLFAGYAATRMQEKEGSGLEQEMERIIDKVLSENEKIALFQICVGQEAKEFLRSFDAIVNPFHQAERGLLLKTLKEIDLKPTWPSFDKGPVYLIALKGVTNQRAWPAIISGVLHQVIERVHEAETPYVIVFQGFDLSLDDDIRKDAENALASLMTSTCRNHVHLWVQTIQSEAPFFPDRIFTPTMDMNLSVPRGPTDRIPDSEPYELLIQSDTLLLRIPVSLRARGESETAPQKQAPPPLKGIRISAKPDKSAPG